MIISTRAYPPTLDEILPPIYLDDTNGFTVNCKIPFYYNRALSFNISKVKIDFYNATSNSFLISQIIDINNFLETKMIDFSLSDESFYNKFIAKSFYKIAISFITKESNGTEIEGFISNLGLAKCFNKKDYSVSILDLNEEDGVENPSLVELLNVTGKYVTNDVEEAVSEYCFTLYQDYGNKSSVIATSGFQLHNNNDGEINHIQVVNDKLERSSSDYFEITSNAFAYRPYRLQYIVKTVNGGEFYSPEYHLIETSNQSLYLGATDQLFVAANKDHGWVEVYLNDFLTIQHQYTGTFRLLRSSEKSDFTLWDILNTVSIQSSRSGLTVQNNEIYIDKFIEQGVVYKYAVQKIQQSNTTNENKLRVSEKIFSNEISVDFEDAFLFDGKRQLCIKFNPKVSTFKTTKLEQKTDTIGGTYPYFSRNKFTDYKELAISGLISFLQDDYDKPSFINYGEKKFYGRTSTSASPPQDYSGWPKSFTEDYPLEEDQVEKERDFKLEVLDWLNDGKPKLFRSPTEGNYIVRLMNVTLAPQDQLGRLLHTFNCSAYEIYPYSFKGLIDSGIFSIQEDIISELLTEEFFIDCPLDPNDLYGVIDLTEYDKIKEIHFYNFVLGTEIKIFEANNNIPTYHFYFFPAEKDENNDIFKIINDPYMDFTRIEYSDPQLNCEQPASIKIVATVPEALNYIGDRQNSIATLRQYISEGPLVGGIRKQYSTVFQYDLFDQLTTEKTQSNYIYKLLIKERPIISDVSIFFNLLETFNLLNINDLDNEISLIQYLSPLNIYTDGNLYLTQDIYGRFRIYQTLADDSRLANTDNITRNINQYYKNFNCLNFYLGVRYFCYINYPIVDLTYRNLTLRGNRSVLTEETENTVTHTTVTGVLDTEEYNSEQLFELDDYIKAENSVSNYGILTGSLQYQDNQNSSDENTTVIALTPYNLISIDTNNNQIITDLQNKDSAYYTFLNGRIWYDQQILLEDIHNTLITGGVLNTESKTKEVNAWTLT